MLGPAVGVEAARERGQVPLLAGLWDTRTKVQAIAEATTSRRRSPTSC